MIRSFLVEELKRTFLPGIGIALALTLFSLLLPPLFSRLQPDAPDIENGVTAVVIFTMVFLTSAGGSNAFGLSFRQGPLRLLENLPIPRHRIWLSRLLVCLLTTIASCGLLVVAHPSVITGNRIDGAVAIAAGMLIFLGGLCLGMLVQAGTAAVMLLSLMTTIPLLALAIAFNVLSTDSRGLSDRSFAVAVGAFCVPLLVAAFVVFMRGEFEVKRRRILNGLLLSGALVGTLASLIAFADLGVLAYGEEWVLMRRNFFTTGWTSSDDGRFLALVLRRESHTPITKLVIVDVSDGKVIKTFRQNNIRRVAWTQDHTLIVLSDGTILERFLGLGTGTARATRIFPDEQRVLSRRRSEWTRTFRADKWGTYASLNTVFPLQRWDGLISLIHLDAPGGAIEALAVPRKSIGIFPDDDEVRGGHLYRPWGGYHPGAWIIGEKIRDAMHQWGPFFPPDEAARKEAQTEFWKIAPSPRTTATTRGAFVWSDNNTSFEEDGWIYFLEANTSSGKARLLARRKSETNWKQVVDGHALSEKELSAMAVPSYEYSDSSTYRLWTGFYNGVVVRIYRAAEKSRILVVNLVNGERWDFEDDNSGRYLPGEGQDLRVVQRAGAMEIQPSRSIRGNAVLLPIAYVYTPGSAPTPIATLRRANANSRNLAFSGPNGTHVYYDPVAEIFTARSANGTARTLWPQ